MYRASASRCLPRASAIIAYRTALPDVSSPPRIVPFKPVNIEGLSDLPFIGPALFQQTPLTFLALGLVVVVSLLLYRTPLGLAIRAVGDNPAAVDAQGLSVTWLRTGAIVVGSALMAMGGAFLTMSAFDAFFFGMVNGRGWICIALTVFASWRPGKALIGALLFGAFDAFQVRLQTEVGAFVPRQVFLMLPYLCRSLPLWWWRAGRTTRALLAISRGTVRACRTESRGTRREDRLRICKFAFPPTGRTRIAELTGETPHDLRSSRQQRNASRWQDRDRYRLQGRQASSPSNAAFGGECRPR